MTTRDAIFPVRSDDDKRRFFEISDEELLHQLQDRFPLELDRLQRAYSIKDESTIRPSTPSPSKTLYDAQYDEVNRTLVSVLSLRWIFNDQYETFVGSQAESVMLLRPCFDWIRDYFTKGLEDPAILDALLTYIVINDLGKDPQLAEDYLSKTGQDISAFNHDIILLQAIEACLVPCVDQLQPLHREAVMRGIRLGAEFNFGQLAQAENAPACLSILRDMEGHEDAFELHFMEQVLDVAGAAGHEDWTCAKKLIQPIFEAYQNVFNVANDIISQGQDLRQGYDVILTLRSEMLSSKGFRQLNVEHAQDRALMRLLCMGGVADLETAKLYVFVWERLDGETKDSLVHALNVDGSVVERAVQPTYMPAMLAHGVGGQGAPSRKGADRGQRRLGIILRRVARVVMAFTNGPNGRGSYPSSPIRKDQAQRLRSMLRYLARVMTLTDEPDGRVVVVERSVLRVLKDVVQSRDFQENPDVLERTEVPESAAAKTA